MALRNPRETERPALQIPRVFDDPRFAEPARVLSALSNHLRKLEALRGKIVLQQQLAGKAPDPASTTDAQLRGLLERWTEESADVAAEPVPMAENDIPASVARGLAIIRGEPIPKTLDHAATLAKIDDETTALEEAIRQQSEMVAEAVEQISAEIIADVKPAFEDMVLKLYRSAQQVSRDLEQLLKFKAAVTASGARGGSHVIATPNLTSLAMLGLESDWSSEISNWRRQLEKAGLLK